MLLMLSVCSPAAFAGEEAVFALNGSTADFKMTARIGHVVDVKIDARDLRDVYGYEIRLTYDAGKLRFRSAATDWEGLTVPPIVEEGRITFAHTMIGHGKGRNDDSPIAALQFETLAPGEADITLTRAKLVNTKVESVTSEPQLTMTVSIESDQKPTSFRDVQHHWAEQHILRAVEMGWIHGFPDGTFKPQDPVTRAEFTTMLARALQLAPRLDEGIGYADGDQIPAYAREAVSQATAAHIVQGFEDRTFRPHQRITRSEITVMIMRAPGMHELEGAGTTPVPFRDAHEIQAWAYPAVRSATELGIVQGRSNLMFVPKGETTRAEAVTLILRLLDHQDQR
ncbi:S-layer homology domain-containing protein [Paenibacillus sp. 1P07SE]|uniref:S-layer homology domain-containing protein n=1 Tax=Paenibacillus sp. 1P07SE TaxID=3132209 RepID=UPI0039A52BE4